MPTRELHAFQDDGRLLIAQRLSGDDILEAGNSDDVAGPRDLHILTVVGVHHQQPPNALLLALVCAERIGARLENATASHACFAYTFSSHF